MIKARACAGDIAAGEALLARALAVHLAQISRLRRGRRHPRHEAADPRLSRPRRDRGRGPQHQARPRRHPRDRVLRADPAAHRRRPASRAARPRDAGDARRAGRGRLDRRAGARRSRRRLSLPARGRAPPADGRRRADPHAAGRSRRARTLRPLRSALRTATRSPRRCSRHLRTVQRHYATLFENAPGAEAGAAGCCVSRARPTTARRSTSSPRWDFASRWKCPRWCGAGSAGGSSLAARRVRARASSPSWCRCCSHQFARSANPDAARARLRPLPRRSARRRPAVLAAAAESRSDRADRAGARHRAAARRQPRAVSAGAWMRSIDPSFFGALPEEAELAAGLDRSLQQAGSYEDFLDRIRMFAQEQMFLIGTRILSGTVSAEQAGEAFARLADVLIRSLHRAVEDDFASLHGRIAGQETAILALGKLGGREMTASSDLDLIVVYDFDPEHPESDGPRPLYGGQYFARLHPAPDQRADRADQLWRALPGRHAAAAFGPLRAARDPDRRLCRAIRRTRPGPGSTWRSRARAWSRPRRHLPRASRASSATCCAGRATREMVAGDVVEMRRRDREGEGRRRALGSQICRRRAGRHRVHRAISAARSRRRDARHPRHLDRARARQGVAARAC